MISNTGKWLAMPRLCAFFSAATVQNGRQFSGRPHSISEGKNRHPFVDAGSDHLKQFDARPKKRFPVRNGFLKSGVLRNQLELFVLGIEQMDEEERQLFFCGNFYKTEAEEAVVMPMVVGGRAKRDAR
ncbi:hypothetical protein M4951_14785 [Blastopirellula sp. J2-11]|uniref:hypothetical protein n=1 Tax=Blastopirellula sp. J2-11 TaxID=2943192 RepID=UPI0021C6D227|nr:hypothetical protein [Blastopirellula sp. J2-11]UUO04655.1 hypothetical protein M4951_14785 [Blastopirellula sp. J2-11]